MRGTQPGNQREDLAVAPRPLLLANPRSWRLCGLTFELSGRRRQDARPGLAKMYTVLPARAGWHAVGAPLERGVRQYCAQHDDGPEFSRGPSSFLLRATARAVAVLRVCGAYQGLCTALCALRLHRQIGFWLRCLACAQDSQPGLTFSLLIRELMCLPEARCCIREPPLAASSCIWTGRRSRRP